MIKELKQLDNGNMPWKWVVAQIDEDTLTAKDKAKSLDAVNVIKEKLDGTIKFRICSNGSK